MGSFIVTENIVDRKIAEAIAAISPGGSSYLVYTAIVSQSGTGAPSAVVLQNTLGGIVTFLYDDVGRYAIALNGAFTANKTWASGLTTNVSDSASSVSIGRVDNDSCAFRVWDAFGDGTNTWSGVSIEIRVYP